MAGSFQGQGKNYVTNFAYVPSGDLQAFNYGNGMVRNYQYNSRMQPAQIKDVTQSGSSLELDLYWGQNATQTTNNNGNLLGQFIGSNINNTSSNYGQSYSYDSLNRLQQVTDSAGLPNSQYLQRSFGYDPYGNMWVSGNSTGLPLDPSTPTSASSFDQTTNRLAGGFYDGNGNQTAVGTGALAAYLSYDPEGRVESASNSSNLQQTYLYDGLGNRVYKYTSGGAATTYVYDATNRLVAEYSTETDSWACQTCYLSWDHLGSTRMVTDENAQVVSRHDFLPFGDELISGYAGRPNPWGGNDNVNQKFTGKERDAQTGLDYFGSRYLGSSMGRFMSPDPLMASAHPENPQSWNRYAYAINNPLSIRDVDGLYPSPAFNCDKNHKTCLNDDQRRILNNSSIKIGDKTLSGEALWNAIGGEKNGEALQNSFVNRTDGLSAIKFADGKSAISFVSSIADIHQDRIFANVGSGLADELAHDSRFGTVSANLHAEGGYNALSYKSNDYPQGNIQFSFNSAHTGADIDHDLYMPGVMHVFGEVIPNHLSGGLTNQDSVRQMLIKNPKIGLTPSPDPKWNRP